MSIRQNVQKQMHSSSFLLAAVPVMSVLGWLVDIFAIGFIAGFLVSYSTRKRKTDTLAVTATAALSGISFIYLIMFYNKAVQSVYSLGLVSTFVHSSINSVLPQISPYYTIVTVFVLYVMFEIGMLSGYSTVSPGKLEFENYNNKMPNSRDRIQSKNASNSTVANTASNYAGTSISTSNALSRDELTVAELFMYGNAKQITPHVDPADRRGYAFDKINGFDWNTTKLQEVLDGLVEKGVVTTDLTDKVLLCKECNSPHIQFRNMCLDCDSMKLEKHKVIEHLSCGCIDKQDLFKAEDGELVCPKCNKKLKLIGSDYRYMPQLYICQSCGSMNKDTRMSAKCADCGTMTDPENEHEIQLYAYQLNPRMNESLRKQIKPFEEIAEYFKTKGHIVTPLPTIKGKSGVNHSFDMMVQYRNQSRKNERYTTHDLVVEVLVSQRAITLDDVTRTYGKLRDIDANSIVCVMPRLSKDAYNYAKTHRMPMVIGDSAKELISKLKAYTIASKILS